MQKNILEYLEQTKDNYPDKIAFSTGKDSMSFSELYTSARKIGGFISKNGFYAKPIAVIMEKHPKTLAAFFGIIYAGCFYVCIDGSMPKARIDAIMQKLLPAALICDAKNKRIADELGIDALYLYDEAAGYEMSADDEQRLADIRRRQSSTDPIYVVFTSGSTGVPKGVIACHRSVIDYTETLCEALEFSADTVFANQTPLFFDAPLKEIMPTLKYGATTYFPQKMLFSFPVRLIEYLNEYKINTICWVASAFVNVAALGALQNHRPEYITKLAFGSEAFPKKYYNEWRAALPNADFYNLYGPTEATGMSCWWKAERELCEDEPIPVGRPFDNTQILLIDEKGQETEQGEICIKGTCLTMGYYNDPEKTAEVFCQNPLNTAYPELIYKTGDIGRINEHGELVFICRKDSQIKHMGHRIELGEIESAALKCKGITRSCCVYDSIGKRIALYYVGDADEGALSAEIKEYLPRYMHPSIVEKLSALPSTQNGKIDRKGLRERAEKS